MSLPDVFSFGIGKWGSAVQQQRSDGKTANIPYLWRMNIERPSESWSDYQLIDSGGFEKLERFGRYTMIRPEPKALWDKALPEGEWKRRAQTAFTPGAGFSKAGKEDSGVWTMLGRMQEQWNITYRLPAVKGGNAAWAAVSGNGGTGTADEAAGCGPCSGGCRSSGTSPTGCLR